MIHARGGTGIKARLQSQHASYGTAQGVANNESSEVFDIIKPGRRVEIKGYRQ